MDLNHTVNVMDAFADASKIFKNKAGISALPSDRQWQELKTQHAKDFNEKHATLAATEETFAAFSSFITEVNKRLGLTLTLEHLDRKKLAELGMTLELGGWTAAPEAANCAYAVLGIYDNDYLVRIMPDGLVDIHTDKISDFSDDKAIGRQIFWLTTKDGVTTLSAIRSDLKKPRDCIDLVSAIASIHAAIGPAYQLRKYNVTPEQNPMRTLDLLSSLPPRRPQR